MTWKELKDWIGTKVSDNDIVNDVDVYMYDDSTGESIDIDVDAKTIDGKRYISVYVTSK